MASYLLDSNAFLWVKTDPHHARREAIAEIVDPANDVFVSVAAIWELAIKSAMGKLDPPVPIDSSDAIVSALRESGFNLLAIQLSHALAAAWLPRHHRDPFDRMMIAQAQHEDLVVVTRDTVFKRY